ncbi:DUF2267 domain-containing protein [Methylobacterium nodulans]|uniref:DUF2267 domain-containing protein n=1 Tax=Methylobacterium nodulans (strain LMG 21967 / CNCM I-2342 / ORS 2060) TaxID=460265 RepID=B8IB29_METNO|nr:DUF2267 domain-containing protein [Methylobacterium nodulans]ACL55422.1 conserved hypothetical protein [Methylobacterium nodulans ORS 2060]
MTVPQEYVQASRDFERFLLAARDALGHATTHRTYATIYSVLLVFRRHVSVRDGLRFATVLPPVLRAIFVSDWDPAEPVRDFADRETLTAEMLSVRGNHNVSPADAIAVVARVLRDHVDQEAYDRVLATLPEPARDYWRDAM